MAITITATPVVNGVEVTGNSTTITAAGVALANTSAGGMGISSVAGLSSTNVQDAIEEITEVPSTSAIDKKGIQLGVIAQEIEQILPDVVKEESTGVKSVNPDNITWYLVNAVKELSAKVDALQNEVNTLKGA